MPILVVPAILVVIAIMLLILLWRLSREGRRRYEYWKQVLAFWRRKRKHESGRP
ncbi:MAG: hypothetical protein AAF567_25210 [Actinomycetota bacterium]